MDPGRQEGFTQAGQKSKAYKAWGRGELDQTECRTGTALQVLLLISLGTCLEVFAPVPVALQWDPL